MLLSSNLSVLSVLSGCTNQSGTANEIHQQKDEEQDISTKANKLPEDQTIQINHLHFSYSGQEEDNVLTDINLTIPEKKVTAIVGASGSGKTTLIKLLLGFYSPQKGDIRIGNLPLDTINPHLWREKTGAVMQDGYIFSDTITENIAVGQHTSIKSGYNTLFP